ncbi:MAG TPA: tripartite tricarboxylate transporter TctB family protein [Thermodesulfobacteriota bacterium]|nr:tripartite tricarboxylate transporter TctB family protein [Thermodesulfobacteriota bacterium]
MAEKETGMSEGVFWIVIGGIICILALQYDLGSFRAPAPGFVAFLSGILIGGIGAVMILAKRVSAGHAKGAARRSSQGAPAVRWGRLAYTMLFLIAYAILMDPLGYIVSTFLAMFGLFFDWEKKNWPWSAFFSIAVSLVSYLVFEIWLHCQLPRGIFPWW